MWTQRLSQPTAKSREEIRRRRAEGLTLQQLAKRFGVSAATISRALSDSTKKQPIKAA